MVGALLLLFVSAGQASPAPKASEPGQARLQLSRSGWAGSVDTTLIDQTQEAEGGTAHPPAGTFDPAGLQIAPNMNRDKVFSLLEPQLSEVSSAWKWEVLWALKEPGKRPSAFFCKTSKVGWYWCEAGRKRKAKSDLSCLHELRAALTLAWEIDEETAAEALVRIGQVYFAAGHVQRAVSTVESVLPVFTHETIKAQLSDRVARWRDEKLQASKKEEHASQTPAQAGQPQSSRQVPVYAAKVTGQPEEQEWSSANDPIVGPNLRTVVPNVRDVR